MQSSRKNRIDKKYDTEYNDFIKYSNHKITNAIIKVLEGFTSKTFLLKLLHYLKEVMHLILYRENERSII